MWCFYTLHLPVCGVCVLFTCPIVVFLCLAPVRMWCFCTLHLSVCGVSVHCTCQYVVFLYLVPLGMWCLCIFHLSVCGVSVLCTCPYVVFLYFAPVSMWCFCTLHLSVCGVSVLFIDYTYLCDVSIKIRQYNCLIWRIQENYEWSNICRQLYAYITSDFEHGRC
jgi:hypothetical protein